MFEYLKIGLKRLLLVISCYIAFAHFIDNFINDCFFSLFRHLLYDFTYDWVLLSLPKIDPLSTFKLSEKIIQAVWITFRLFDFLPYLIKELTVSIVAFFLTRATLSMIAATFVYVAKGFFPNGENRYPKG